MPRHRYGAKIDTWSTGDIDFYTNDRAQILAAFGDIRADIRLHKGTGMFTVELPLEIEGNIIHSKSLEDLRNKVISFLRDNAQPLNWIPFIKVTMKRKRDFSRSMQPNSKGFLDIEPERRHYSYNNRHQLLITNEWKDNPAHHNSWHKAGLINFTEYCQQSEKTAGLYILRYSEALWQNLLSIVDTIEEAKERLFWLLESEEGMSILVSEHMPHLLLDE